MKHFKFTLSVRIAAAIAILYFLQSCGGVHYNSYVEDYKDIAIEEMIRTGYPASIKLAQAILESEGGRSELAIDYNNHFGILCDKKWKGQKYWVTEEDFATGEKFESCYKIYDDPEESFVEHTNLLKKDPYYKSLFRLKDSNYAIWAKQLTDLRYTGNETYDLTLINMIKKYNLEDYDDIALGHDSEYADISDQEIDEYNPPTYDDYEDDHHLANSIREKERLTQENIDDQLATLREDIKNHKSRFPEDRASLEKELEEQLSDNYSGRDYEYPNHPSYQTRADRYNSTTYNNDRETSSYDNNSNRRQSNPRAAIDAKYDLNKTDYPTANNRTYREPIKQPYSAPNNNRRRSTYQEPTTTAQNEDDNWLGDSSEGTSISDFADDYTYINGSIVVYARHGDSPLTIAKRYNASVKDIVNFNEAVSKNTQPLREGMTIFLEAKKKNYLNGERYHIVQMAETMEDIAAMYGLILEALYVKNKMPNGSQPAIGESIKLDKGKIRQRPELRSNYPNEYQAPKPIAPPRSVAIDDYDTPATSNRIEPVRTVLLQPVTTSQRYHTVKAGQSLYGIARLYDFSPEKLMRMNGLTNTRINVGMRLIIRE